MSSLNRREFLKWSSAAGALAKSERASAQTRGISIEIDPKDATASAPASKWAAGVLREALVERNITDFRITAGGPAPNTPRGAEAFSIAPGRVTGSDTRGLVYGLL